MAAQLDTDKLSHAIRQKRGSAGLRQTANEIDISHTTLSRLEQGHVPDVDTYIRICKWLEVTTDFFIVANNPRQEEPDQKMVALLRADKTLPKNVADALIQMISIAYNQERERQNQSR